MSPLKWIFAALPLLIASSSLAAISVPAESDLKGATREAEVSPNEDLMREHGLLRRVLLIYGELERRFGAGEDPSPAAVRDSAGIIKTFIEGYHEKLEEDYLFAGLRKAGRELDLVGTLEKQHLAGRVLTGKILDAAEDVRLGGHWNRPRMGGLLRQFIDMYGPHAAREDTVLFPAWRQTLTDAEYEELGEAFEDREGKMFGEEGFEKMVDKAAQIEKDLGIYDLKKFTPR